MNNDLLNILSHSNKDIDNQQLMDYLSGKLSGPALHEVERQMAGSEFINDAIEGLQHFENKKDIQAYVGQLNANLQKNLHKKKERRNRKRIKEYPWIYLAVILVLSLCCLAYYLIHKMMH